MISTRMTMKMFGMVVSIALLMLSKSYAMPAFDGPKPSYLEGNNQALLDPGCNPAISRCWEWLPVDVSRTDDNTLEEDFKYDRMQPVHVRDVEDQEAYAPAYSAPKQLQLEPSRLVKKDVFMSRGWGAGGMPFSVLYMNPRVNHQQPTAGTNRAGSGKGGKDSANRTGDGTKPTAMVEPTQKPNNQQVNRLALRNGGYGQSRRHYSIIPQLFISYGWGPSGK